MPRTKKQPETTPTQVTLNGAVTGEELTLTEAGAYLKLSETDVLRLVNEQGLPARQLGNEWRFLKQAIQQWLSTSTLKTNKEAWMALAGIWKDDPFAEKELKEIHRRRGRPMTEDET